MHGWTATHVDHQTHWAERAEWQKDEVAQQERVADKVTLSGTSKRTGSVGLLLMLARAGP